MRVNKIKAYLLTPKLTIKIISVYPVDVK